MNEEVKKMLTAIGSMAELCWAFYTAAIKQGFSRKYALQLTIAFLNNTIE